MTIAASLIYAYVGACTATWVYADCHIDRTPAAQTAALVALSAVFWPFSMASATFSALRRGFR